MARVGRSNASLDEIVRSAVEPLVARLASTIAKHVVELTARQIEAELARSTPRRGRAASVSRSRPRNVELTRWVADRRARRVPNFVIELTGLATKKQIIAKYGPDAAFEKGKPAPAEAKHAEAKREVKAKPPIVRKNGKAAAA